MTYEEIGRLSKMKLAEACMAQFGTSRGDIIGATNDSMREALRASDGSLLKRPNGEPLGTPKETPAFVDIDEVVEKVRKKLNGTFQGSIDEEALFNRLRGKINGEPNFTFTVKRLDATVELGRVHKQFSELLAWVELGSTYPMLVGPAGSFKTSAAVMVAKALGLGFEMISCSEGMTSFDLLGFTDANGKVVRTALREAWEHGKVFLCDEIDAGNANVVATLNAMLSMQFAAFPDGIVARHENFVFLCAANTNGSGADSKYCGRNQLDGASLDRFPVMFWDYDTDFEVHVAGSDQAEWTSYVHRARAAAVRTGVAENVVFATPRAAILGAKALRAGKLSRAQIEQALLWGKLSSEDAAKVKANMRSH